MGSWGGPGRGARRDGVARILSLAGKFLATAYACAEGYLHSAITAEQAGRVGGMNRPDFIAVRSLPLAPRPATPDVALSAPLRTGKAG